MLPPWLLLLLVWPPLLVFSVVPAVSLLTVAFSAVLALMPAGAALASASAASSACSCESREFTTFWASACWALSSSTFFCVVATFFSCSACLSVSCCFKLLDLLNGLELALSDTFAVVEQTVEHIAQIIDTRQNLKQAQTAGFVLAGDIG